MARRVTARGPGASLSVARRVTARGPGASLSVARRVTARGMMSEPIAEHLSHCCRLAAAEGLQTEPDHVRPALQVVETVHLGAQAVPQRGDLFVQFQLV